jgi:WD40 repeat protein
VAFTPDGRRLATSRGGQVRLLDARTGKRVETLGAEGDPAIQCGTFAPRGRLLATGARDHAIRLWDLDAGKIRKRLEGHQDGVSALAFSPDGRRLASGSWDRTVRLWSVAAGQEVGVLEGHKGKVLAVAFAPNGRVLATGGDEPAGSGGQVLLWKAGDPKAAVRRKR